MKALFINKIKKFSILALILTLCGASCKEKEPVPEKIDVQFEVPAQMTIDDGASEISFRVQFAKPPVSGDQIILGSGATEYVCPVTSVSDTRFSASISGVWSKGFGPGTYTVSHQRGSSKSRKGTMDVIVKYAGDEEVEPAAGSTVYGKVSCEGTPLAGVVVSDGVEVVKTDSKGVYQMKSKKYNGYVFVSTPSGYEPLVSGLLPRFHATLKANASTAERVDFQLKKVDGQDNHRMLMLGDIHLAKRTNDQKQFAEFVKDLNATITATSGKVYAMTLGDMTWDLYWIVNNYSFKEYLADAAGIKGVMLYHTIGNHDHSMYYMGDFDTVKDYKESIGPTYYSFNIGKVHYVVLDDVECTNQTATKDDSGNPCYKREYNGRVVADELAWLRKDLASVPNGTPLVVTMHIPLYNNKGQYSLKEASTLASILKPYPEVHLYTAHTHTIYNQDELQADHLYEHNAGSVCGTWWWSGNLTPGVHIGQDGSPGGYTILDITGTSFKWQYKATGKGTDFQFRTYDRNQIHITKDAYAPKYTGSDFDASLWKNASSANEVYINVWNWDPAWKVEVSEGGTPLTVSQLISGEMDPLHYIAYTAKRYNSNATATFATTTNRHLFKVTASSANSTLDIRVTDRFGNVYTETMTRPKAFSTEQYKF
ncbi:MAG: calcineurin-like phosphoesterase C-terminal domain-containing protein [Bacteroidales bacterium]|nr:calcineurin-like phosphoesterase C-terminal domain-containing protein [Bacteroidales bacterium]